MYLKSLKAIGFKSFADKTTLNFEPGITAVVGPNGCGKSNISDAIRWVLGEQSAKALRGGEMADVIFSGTEGAHGRKPTSMAEVSITLGDMDEENLKAAGVDLSFTEVTVTRRVFRDGGSEYFLNGASCRLRDIQQLFMGTGIGRNSYSIMAQGQITNIIKSKPSERRVVFEEAAGITKFKQQKKEALRKLDYTEQNLLRLEDTIREVKRQIGSLQRQAGKARRYQKIMDELRELETKLARHEFDAIDVELQEIRKESEHIRDKLENNSSGIIEEEVALKELRQTLTKLDRQISATQQRGLELKAEVERHENRIQYNEQRMEELDAQHADAETDIAGAQERRKQVDAELEGINQQLADSGYALDRAHQHVTEKRGIVETAESEINQRQTELHDTNNEATQLTQRLTSSRNELNALELQKQGNAARLEKLSAEKIQLEEERGKLETSLGEFERSVEDDSLHVETHRGTVEERQARLSVICTDLSDTEEDLDGLLQRQAEAKSRKDVLKQLIESKEGFSAGAQTVLTQFDSAIGSLADQIRVPDEHVRALEAALGANLQLVITEQSQSADQMLHRLAQGEQGRASIVALELLRQRGGAIPPADIPEGAVHALDIVETDDRIQPLLQTLLGRTLIVDSLETATRLWRMSPGRFDYVTRQGESLSQLGVYTGGQGEGKEHHSVLARRNQIDELEVQLNALGRQIDQSSRVKGQLLAEQTELQASLQNARDELSDREVAIATRKGEFKALQNSRQVLEQKIEAVVFEVQNLAEQEETSKGKSIELNVRIRQMEEKDHQIQESILGHETFIQEQRNHRETAQEELTEAKVALSKAEERESSLQDQKAPMEQQLAELQRTLERAQQTLSESSERKVQFESQNAESRREIERLRVGREATSEKAVELTQDRNKQAADAERREMELSDKRNSLTEMQERKGEIEVEVTQKQMKQEQLVDRIKEKYDLDLREVQGDVTTINITADGQTTTETVTTAESTAGTEVATDWDTVRTQVEEMQSKIESMGPVNLVAIDEYQEVEERFNFLNSQHEDLVNAKTELEEVIARIDKQSREMFAETFEKVRANFQKMFPDLFGGGRADLVLTEEEDVLEAGVEIVASPPGKKLHRIGLLSGGEQTMTAVALLFSLYQVKPSPFCVLDELDAPLDDANIERYVQKLKEFLAHSQFIVITHSKRTISAADVLYGVTMQERGVSRIVSVKFGSDNTETPERNGDLQTEEAPAAPKKDNEEVFLAK
ncbi:MAG TPA: chromosome segregation protein SMC [Verrucomicrobiales bacterium]|nr:chromosome segregation protein SMC [Verrucomicrobiales bacterium]